MIITTGDVKDKEYEILGIVSGNEVQTKNVFKDLGAGLKHIVGGSLGSYKKLLTESRQKAIDGMIEEAKALKADAIIWVRQNTSSIVSGASEISMLGTAIKFK